MSKLLHVQHVEVHFEVLVNLVKFTALRKFVVDNASFISTILVCITNPRVSAITIFCHTLPASQFGFHLFALYNCTEICWRMRFCVR